MLSQIAAANLLVPKSRVIILADMGNEPDEEQQMTHLLMYSNEMDIEGLIAVSGYHLHADHRIERRRKLYPNLFHKLIDGYEKVYPNLQQHAEGWQPPDALRKLVVSGQHPYGMDGVGDGKATAGSKLIIKQVTNDDPRPLYIVANAGSNTLAQALHDYRKTHSETELKAFIAKLRVFENAAQDEAGAWINHEFPDIYWIRSCHQTKGYGGPKPLGPYVWKPHAYNEIGQDAWASEHIRTYHGALGELYPPRYDIGRYHFIEGGGTIPWMQHVAHGLSNPSEPSWGGWSGRYTINKVKNVPSSTPPVVKREKVFYPYKVYTDERDVWTDPKTGVRYDNKMAPVWRWRRAMWNDFQARMDWCVKPYGQANHKPIAALDGDRSDTILIKTVEAGEKLSLDASASTDPDNDTLRFKWWVYPEAGRNPYGKSIRIEDDTNAKISLTIPQDAVGKEIHLILEVWDQSKIVPLVDYRRVIINANKHNN